MAAPHKYLFIAASIATPPLFFFFFANHCCRHHFSPCSHTRIMSDVQSAVTLLQLNDYISLVIATAVIYDYLLTISNEVHSSMPALGIRSFSST